MSYFQDILENLPLFGKVFAAVASIVFGVFGLLIHLNKNAFEKNRLAKEKKVESDKKLFEEFKKVFSVSIDHIQDHEQSKYFPEDGLCEFSSFCYDWNDSEHKFLDDGIEKEKEALRKLICNFKNFILDKMELRGANYILPYNPSEYDAIMKQMEKLSIQVWESHQKFISNTQRYLYTL